MRISTLHLERQGVNSILDQQRLLAKTQEQLATGKRIISPSDDPAAATRILELRRSDERTAQYQENIGLAEIRLQRADVALQSATTIYHRLKELAVQGLNDSNSDADKDMIAIEVRQRLAQLMDEANARDANGEYLFAGFQTQTQPFTGEPEAKSGATFTYHGDEGQRFSRVSATREVATNEPGSDVFMSLSQAPRVRIDPAGAIGNAGSMLFTEGSVSPVTPGPGTTTSIDTALGAGASELGFNFAYDPVSRGYIVTVNPVDDVNGANITLNGSDTDGGVNTFLYIPDGVPDPSPPGPEILIHPGDQLTVDIPAYGTVDFGITGEPADGDTFTIKDSPGDIFTAIYDFAVALESGERNSDFLTDLDLALERALQAQARVGSNLQITEKQTEINEDHQVALKKAISQLEDLDYAEAVSRMNLEMTGLQAAQQSYMKIQGLSLFNYL